MKGKEKLNSKGNTGTPGTGSDPCTHEDSSPNSGAGMPETGSVIALTFQNHINN
jgi:hypothetical protein